jgi:hypothetical protein
MAAIKLRPSKKPSNKIESIFQLTPNVKKIILIFRIEFNLFIVRSETLREHTIIWKNSFG